MPPKSILISIKPKFIDLIIKGIKTHEFRKRIPASPFDSIVVYTTVPVAEVRYVLTVAEPVEFPNMIAEHGYGNRDFNEGRKKSKFAIPIMQVHELENPISLVSLRDDFLVTPPQSFVYMDSCKILNQHILKSKMRQIL